METSPFLKSDKGKIVLWFSGTILVVVFLFMLLFNYYSSKRKISLKDYTKEEESTLVQAVSLPNGKFLLVDFDSTVIQIPEFDQFFFNTGTSTFSVDNITIHDFLIKRRDSVYLYDVSSMKPIVSDKVDKVFMVNSTLCSVEKNNLYGFISLANKKYVQPAVFSYYNAFRYAIICQKDGKYGLLELNGEILTDFNFDVINDFDEKGRATYKIGDDVGIISYSGGDISKASICQGCNIKANSDGFILEKDGLVGLADSNGQLILDIKYQSINFSNGDYYLYTNGLIGLYNPTNNFLIEPQYNNITKTSGGYFIKQYGLNGFINTSGKIVIEPQYDNISTSSNGCFIVERNGYKGVMNSSGVITIPVNYLRASFSGIENYVKVQSQNGKYGWLNSQTGEVIIEPVFDIVKDDFESSYSIITVTKNGKTEQLRPDGRLSNGESLKDWLTRIFNN
jgi:hypothetical protein